MHLVQQAQAAGRAQETSSRECRSPSLSLRQIAANSHSKNSNFKHSTNNLTIQNENKNHHVTCYPWASIRFSSTRIRRQLQNKKGHD